VSQADFVSRGQALVAAGQYQEAVKVCRLGLLGRPTTVEGRVVLGQALLALKRYDEVLAEMRVALELDHSSIPAQILKGEALLRKGDNNAAIETLHKVRQAAPGDAQILKLLAQAEQASAKPPMSTSHPSVSYVGATETKHYPGNAAEGEEDSGGGYTRPTSLSAPGALRRSSERRAAVPEGTPSPAELAVGDKSGTVEVDPELEGVEVPDDVDFDDLAAPPKAAKPAKIGGARGNVKSSRKADHSTVQGTRKSQAEALARKKPSKKESTPALDLDDEDVVELAETRLPPSAAKPRARLPGPISQVRNAVGLPSGPIDAPAAPAGRFGQEAEPPGSMTRGREKGPSAPPPLAQSLAAQPHHLQVTQLPPPPSGMAVPRLAASMPTVAAAPMPPSPASVAASHRPTLAIQPPPQQAPNWAQATALPPPPDPRSMAAAFEPTARPDQLIDPHLAALFSGSPADAVAIEQPSITPMPPGPNVRTGMRKPRSKLQIAMWALIASVVIGGGAFAGFQIRAMRLQKQIAALRDRATDLAKADTWSGWNAAYNSLADIANASATLENRAALARARALIAYEFHDGVPDAKAQVDGLGGQGGLDANLAAAFLALAQNDGKAAKLAADAALQAATPQDPAALYVTGQAALLNGDLKLATLSLKDAYGKEARPMYGVALAHAYAAGNSWEDAATTLERVLGASPDYPAAMIEKARVFAAAGRVVPTTTTGMDLRGGLQKLVAEAGQPLAKQPRGVAPAQVAFAELALARVDYARGDATSARGDLRAASDQQLDDQRFAEEAIDTLYAMGDLTAANSSITRAMNLWPASKRTRITLAEVLLASGRANDAIDTLVTKQIDATTLPLGLAVRGVARAKANDVDGGRADLEAALKKAPNLEAALVGRAWMHLDANELDDARKLIEPHNAPAGMSPAITTIYAAILSRSKDAVDRTKAKSLLEKVVAGPQGLDAGRAQLELARIDADLGDFAAAKTAFAEAIKNNAPDARLESALLMIEQHDPAGARETLEALYKDSGERPQARLVLELARARMLVGANDEAKKLLDGADKLPDIVKWKLERERGRLALRKGDIAAAATAFGKALDSCGGDYETFLLAADTATADEKQTAGLAEKVKKLAPQGLKGQPEAKIVAGKLAIAAGKDSEALTQFNEAASELKKATVRRQAQAHYGIAFVKYDQHADGEAINELGLVNEQDPSLYSAYLFHATLLAGKKKKEAFDLARKAVTYNPDSADGWLLVGTLGDRKARGEALAKLGTLTLNADQQKQLAALKR
jgi:predicted Zn-dependent protease